MICELSLTSVFGKLSTAPSARHYKFFPEVRESPTQWGGGLLKPTAPNSYIITKVSVA